MTEQQEPHQQQQIAKKQHKYEESSRQYVAFQYTHQEFPKWKYHADGRSFLVETEAAEKRLGPEWRHQRPDPVNTEAKSEAELRRENESLKRQLTELKGTRL